jgi:hypothetical protein
MDTWPANQFLGCLGVNFNVGADDAEATAQVLAAAGFHSARVELGWGNLDYDDPGTLSSRAIYQKILGALRDAGIRPLILLNANSMAPVPFKRIRVSLTKPAVAGAREVFFNQTNGIRPGYTGFTSLLPQRLGFPLITAVEPATGRCELSAPLPKDLTVGPLVLADLKYHPFSDPLLEDGTPNQWAQETVEGWKTYVRTVCQFVKETLGSEGQSDAGFDVEVWNELTFGSAFLGEENYYQPKRVFKNNFVYQNHGSVVKGVISILPMTVDLVNDPANRLPGVHVISGFSNQWPWESGTDIWPSQAGFSRHFYTSLDPDRPFNGVCGFLSPGTIDRPGEGPINALGFLDGQRDNRQWHTVIPGSYFAPTVHVSLPEAWQYGYKIEYITRDVQPFPGLWDQHFRFSNPGDGRPAEFWMTETNTDRSAFLWQLQKRFALSTDDPALVRLSHHLGAKALLRTFVFQSSKGVHTIELYAARHKDLQLALIPESFFAALKRADHRLTDDVQAQAGEQLAVLSRVVQLMRQGDPLSVTRPLGISRIVEHDPRLVFSGDGTPEHPDRFNREDFACLPFQLNANRFAIAYYVVSQNMAGTCRPELAVLDPARYDMRPQLFDVTITNVAGEHATVSVWDPFSNNKVPVGILAASKTDMTVQLESMDYPRFLIIEETEPGPLILEPRLVRAVNGSAKIAFHTNLPVSAKLTWGAWPQRVSSGSIQLPRGDDFEYSIPHLVEHEGVHIEVERNGLIIPWPRWSYDVAGVVWPDKVDHQNRMDPAHPPLARLPALSPEHLPETYQIQLPPELKWKEARGQKTAQVGAGVTATRVSLFTVTDARDAAKLLPGISVVDRCEVKPEEVNGALGWRVDVKLASSGYPKDPDICKIIYIVPAKEAWVEVKFEGNEAAFAVNRKDVGLVLSGIRFSYK